MFDDLLKCIRKHPEIEEMLEELEADPEQLVVFEIMAQKGGCESAKRMIEAQLKVKKLVDEVFKEMPIEYDLLLAEMEPIIAEVHEKISKITRYRRR